MNKSNNNISKIIRTNKLSKNRKFQWYNNNNNNNRTNKKINKKIEKLSLNNNNNCRIMSIMLNKKDNKDFNKIKTKKKNKI
jgi:hypothetical protein